MNMIKSCDII